MKDIEKVEFDIFDVIEMLNDEARWLPIELTIGNDEIEVEVEDQLLLDFINQNLTEEAKQELLNW